MAGVTPTGFDKKHTADLLAEIEADQRAKISQTLNLLPSSVLGMINGIFSDKLRELWDVAEAVYRSQYPDTASGDALDNIAAITGTVRLPATRSQVVLEVDLTANTELREGRRVSSPGRDVIFETAEKVTATSAGSYQVNAQATDTGPIPAPAGTLTEIITKQSGWNSVTNPLDADLGRDRESDPAFRRRRRELLRVTGAATMEAIRARVRRVPDVTQVLVFENTTMSDDAHGLPPKSLEVVVSGGHDDDIARAVFETKPAGIEAFGSTTINVDDSQGFSHEVRFSRPTFRDLHVSLDVQVDPSLYEPDHQASIKQRIVDLGDSLQLGDDIRILRFRCEPLEIASVLDVPAMRIDIETPPVNTTNITLKARELARLDTSRITVNTVNVA